MKEEIYMFMTDTSIDYERSVDVRLFKNFDDAQKVYFEWREKHLAMAKEYGWELGIMHGTEFSAYEEGYHAQNHFDAVIEKVEVE